MYQLLSCLLYTITVARLDLSMDSDGFNSYTTVDIGGKSTSRDSYKEKKNGKK